MAFHQWTKVLAVGDRFNETGPVVVNDHYIVSITVGREETTVIALPGDQKIQVKQSFEEVYAAIAGGE